MISGPTRGTRFSFWQETQARKHFRPHQKWWATKDLNLGPLPCEGSALTTELVARNGPISFVCSRLFVAEGSANCKPTTTAASSPTRRASALDRARREGQGRRDPARADHAARARPPADRRRSRRRQDHSRAGARAIVPLLVPAHSIHLGPAAERRDRRERVQPGGAGIRIQARPDLRQHHRGRRNQPHHAEDAVRAARSDERIADHRGQPHASAAAAVHGARDAESRSSTTARIRCPNRSSTVS